jgi:hypothetical protein
MYRAFRLAAGAEAANLPLPQRPIEHSAIMLRAELPVHRNKTLYSCGAIGNLYRRPALVVSRTVRVWTIFVSFGAHVAGAHNSGRPAQQFSVRYASTSFIAL